jgi:hypothetical protein
MEDICTIGMDIAKHAFQVYGATASGEVVLRKKLRRHAVGIGDDFVPDLGALDHLAFVPADFDRRLRAFSRAGC